MRVGCLVVLLALTLLPGVSAKDLQPVTVVDLFQDIDVQDLVFTTSCGDLPNANSQFIPGPDNRSFQFREGQAPATQLQFEGRSAYVGCGSAAFTAAVPTGTDHLHVRFIADRVVNAQMPDFTVNFTQELHIAFDGGPSLVQSYFQASDFTQPPTAFDPPAVPVPDGARQVVVTWTFKDHGAPNQVRLVSEFTGAPSPVSAQTMNVTVTAPQIEFSGPAVLGTVRQAHRVIEDKESQQTRVAIDVQPELMQAFQVNLRVEVDETLRLVEVITPNGTHLRQFSSNPLAGTPGFRAYSPEGGVPLVEPRIDFYRATLPGQIVAAHGAGTYTFVFAREVPLDGPFELLLVVFLVLALPLLMGTRALVGVWAFRREAFGLYKKSSSALLLGVLLTLAYYLAFVIQLLQQGQYQVMAHWPVTSRGLLLYVNVLLAVAALAAFGIVGRYLAGITRPAADL